MVQLSDDGQRHLYKLHRKHADFLTPEEKQFIRSCQQINVPVTGETNYEQYTTKRKRGNGCGDGGADPALRDIVNGGEHGTIDGGDSRNKKPRLMLARMTRRNALPQ